jgi:cell division protein FtsL
VSGFLEWVTHGFKRGRFELNSRAAVAIFAIVVALTLVTSLYLALVSQTAAQGRRIEQLQAEVFRLQRENERTMVEIAQESAIPRLMSRARALGLAPAERVEFLTGPD